MIDENIAHVIELEKSLLGEEGRHSVKVLDNLLADDFMEISSTARMYDKKSVIAALTQGDDNDSITGLQFHGKYLANDMILVTFISYYDYKYSRDLSVELR